MSGDFSIKKLLKKVLPKRLLQALLIPYHWKMALLANIIYLWPARGQKIIMITGTNGKTTTSAFLGKILESAGYSVGISTTAFFQVGDEYELNDLNMTVSNPFKLQKLLRRMRKKKVDYIILETTSHALHQHRVMGAKPLVAIMTNLTQDHLDYHGTMDNYAAAKAKLFKMKPRFSVLNRDDDWFGYFDNFEPRERGLSYGTDSAADCKITKANLMPNGSKLTISLENTRIDTRIQLAGKFNAYNALAAATAAHILGVSSEEISTGLQSLESVPGRMEAIENTRGINIIVDYAHTPDALQKSLETLKQVTKGNLIAVYGATGDRDKAKRPIMGEIVATLADVSIVTDDEPYTENPLRIREEVLAGAQSVKNGGEIIEIGDRRGAIQKALLMAKKNDTVFFTGIGSQQYRKIGESKEKWDEREVVRELLAQL